MKQARNEVHAPNGFPKQEEPAKGDRLTPFTYGLAIIFLLHFFDKLLLPK
jgi:hypothetical protein